MPVGESGKRPSVRNADAGSVVRAYQFHSGERVDVELRGFEEDPAFHLGNSDQKTGLEVQVYVARGEAPGERRYLVATQIGETPEWTLCQDFPSLLRFLGAVAPICSVEMASVYEREWQEHLYLHKKPNTVCRFCRAVEDQRRPRRREG